MTIQAGNLIAKIANWGNDIISVFSGFAKDEYGWYMTYVSKEVPTAQPAIGTYKVVSARQEMVLFKDGDKDWLDEWLPCTFFKIEGWDTEYRIINSEHSFYWVPVKGEGYDFTGLSLEALNGLAHEIDYEWEDYIARQAEERAADEAAEDAYYDYLEQKAG